MISINERQTKINFVLRANNELLDCKLRLSSLFTLEQLNRRTTFVTGIKGLGLQDILVEKALLQNRIESLRKIIKYRVSELLGYKIFCEVTEIVNGSATIPKNSVTKFPVEQLSTSDLNLGYINLTRCRVLDLEGTKKRIVLTTITLILHNGKVIETPLGIYGGSLIRELIDTSY